MKQLCRLLSFGSAAALVAVLIASSLIGSLCGSSFAIDNIYHSVWFIALWALLAVTAMIYILCTSRRASLVILHSSLCLVLLGAAVSFFTSQHGEIAVAQEGAPASMFTTPDGRLEKLPFRLQLTRIDTLFSKGGKLPNDYKAHIIADDKKEQTVHAISLNSPMRIKGYQFCIKGVSEGNLSLLLSKDPYGRRISYAGYFMVFIAFIMLFFDRQSGFGTTLQQLKGKDGSKTERENERGRTFTDKAIYTLFIPVTLLALLWYKRGIFPASSGAEALLLLAFVITVLAVLARSRKEFTHLSVPLFITATVATVTAVCSFEWNSSVQPILRTPLLSLHVTVIIIAYALIASTAVNAVIALCSKNKKRMATQALLGRLMLYPATMLLATGIFIGAVWANISWGRYWGWDPKEVWALITLLVCSVAFHTRSLRLIAKPKAFHLFSILAFLAVLFTYFGVNYLLGGLHSYA